MALGLALSAGNPALAHGAVAALEPVGAIFVNAIRMTVVPLVFSSLVVGIATSASTGAVARIGIRGLVVFVLLLTAAAVVGALIAPPLLSHIAADPNALAGARAAAAQGGGAAPAGAMLSPSEWLVALVPANPIRAAVDGAMLPLIVFALVLGLALLSLEQQARHRVVMLFSGIAESMLVMVRWILALAPIGVFALAVPLVARLGASALSALATYVALVSIAAAVFMLLVLYPCAAWFGGISIRRFAQAAAPAQAVAFASRSSLAALPAMIESARTRLDLADDVTSFFLPLAASVFRVGGSLGVTVGAVFIARLYGVAITPPQLVTIVATAVASSFSIPGVPGGSIIAMVPVLLSVGLPVAGVGILLGVDTIPDMFRTTANTTGQLAAAAIVGRRSRLDAPPASVSTAA